MEPTRFSLMVLLVIFGAYTEYQAEKYLAMSKVEQETFLHDEVELACNDESMTKSATAICD
jgi:hypothetical protein